MNAAPLHCPPIDELPASPALPDPLRLFDGTPVETPEQWQRQRRPELMALFSHYVYGWTPPAPALETHILQEDVPVLGGKASLKEIEIRFPELGLDAPRIHLALFLPQRRPAPLFLALNDVGNQTVVDDEAVHVFEDAWVDDKARQKGATRRGAQRDFWCLDYLVERGWGLATFHQSDIDPDRDDFGDGIHPHYADMPQPAATRWGTIAAWAWGLSRCLDALVQEPEVDGRAVCVTGHSRRGKTALLAGALDERFALAVPHQSGTGGCALSRGNDQETVERINQAFPHWFNDVFPQFGGREAQLPVDQHLLMALMAPRPLLDTAGLQDAWANPPSAFKALKAADPVYRLLGVPGLVGDGHVDGDAPLGDCGALLQYRRDTDHTLNQGYWRAMLDFADHHLDTAP